MKVLKFGGTSVGSPQRMKEVAHLILNGEKNLVVLSAMSGTTNSLVEIADYYSKGNTESAKILINRLRTKYHKHVEELYSTDSMKQATRQLLDEIFNRLLTIGNNKSLTVDEEKEIL